MPQMAPMMWLTLFMSFNILMFTFMANIYFTKTATPKMKKSSLISTSTNWSW